MIRELLSELVREKSAIGPCGASEAKALWAVLCLLSDYYITWMMS